MKIDTLLIKPTGPNCNLSCKYCFYKGKSSLYPGNTKMDTQTAEQMISQMMIRRQPVVFSWQGGEPTLMGLDFFKEVIRLQKKHGKGGQRVINTIQTNGLLINEEWAKFFSHYNFLVGLSLDGPSDLHNAYRKYPSGKGSWEEVMEAVKILKKQGVEFNILCVLNNRTVKQPKRILAFFLQHGLTNLQFIPAVETEKTKEGKTIADFSPNPRAVGEFLHEIFQEWTKNFPPSFSMRYFEELISKMLGQASVICKLKRSCGSYLVVEYNGDLYPCDFYVEGDWKLGNLTEIPIEEIVKKDKFKQFTSGKSELSTECEDCNFLDFCQGGCQRYRGLLGSSEEKTYLCEAYKYFLSRNLKKIESIVSKLRSESLRASPADYK